MVCCKGTPAGSGTSIKNPAVKGTSNSRIESIFHQLCFNINRYKLTIVCNAKMGFLYLENSTKQENYF